MGDILRKDGQGDSCLAGAGELRADESEPERTLCAAEFALDFDAFSPFRAVSLADILPLFRSNVQRIKAL